MRNRSAAVFRITLASAAAFLAASGVAQAENWKIETSGSGKLEIDDNPLLSANDAESVTGVILTPALRAKHDTGASQVEFGGQLEANQYDDSSFNSNDVYVDALGRQKFSTGMMELRGSFNYDTTRTSEVSESGLSIAGVRHTTFSLRPHIETALTQTEQLNLDGSFTNSKYDSNQYTDYRNYSIKPSLRHAFNEVHSGIFAVEASRYESTSGTGVTADNLIPSVGWDAQLSPRWRTNIAVGVQYTNTDYDIEGPNDPSGSEWDYYYSGGLTFTGLNDKIAFDFSRRPSSLSSGAQSQATMFRLNGTHTINPKLDLKLGLIYQNSQRSGSNSSSNDDISFIEAAPQLVYRLTETLNLNLMYRHREREIGSSDATSDAVMMTLTFKPEEFSID